MELEMSRTTFLQSCDLRLWIWEHFCIKFKITPMESLHPETIEMEDLNWDISCAHAFQERIDCFLVIVCGETCT